MLAFPGSSECKIIYSLFNICQSLVTVAPAQPESSPACIVYMFPEYAVL